MDPASLIAAIVAFVPQAAPYVGYLTAFIGICAILAAIAPPATDTSPKWWQFVRHWLDWCAANKGNSTNITSHAAIGLVGGPTALSNPQISTGSVAAPLAEKGTTP